MQQCTGATRHMRAGVWKSTARFRAAWVTHPGRWVGGGAEDADAAAGVFDDYEDLGVLVPIAPAPGTCRRGMRRPGTLNAGPRLTEGAGRPKQATASH